MTKLEELQAKLEAKRQKRTALVREAQNLLDEGKVEEARAKLEELRTVRAQIDSYEDLIAEMSAVASVAPVIPAVSAETATTNSASIVRACIKKFTRKPMTEAENALLLPTTENPNGESNESYILPVDIYKRIVKKIRQYKSIREDIGYLKVGALSGTIPTDDIDSLQGLSDYTDGNELKDDTDIMFAAINYTLAEKAGFIALSNSLLALADEDLLEYVVEIFAKRTVITENDMAFKAMAKNKVAKIISAHTDLTGSIIEDIDPAFEDMVVILVNQSGFKWMDAQVYEDGKKVLHKDPATGKWMFGDYYVSKYPNRHLKNNTDGTSPVFYGAVSEGVKLLDLGKVSFAASSEAGFKLNATLARIIEFVDVQQFDDSDACYCMGAIKLTAATTVVSDPEGVEG